MLRAVFERWKSGTEHLNYGRPILQGWGADAYAASAAAPFRVLDIGCGPGTDLTNIRSEIQDRGLDPSRLELYGIESYPPNVETCEQLGIQTHALDIERDVYPGKSASFDIVLANQVLEHTKEVFWIFSEVSRLLKKGGYFLVGVPNIASFHNRLLLLFGQQPTQIQTLSAHVRGFTRPDMRKFAEEGGLFALRGFRGSNFYPFPPLISKPLSRVFPTLAWGSFYMLERTQAYGDFLDCLSGDVNFLETPFYGSPQNPAPPPEKRKRSLKSKAREGALSKPARRRSAGVRKKR